MFPWKVLFLEFLTLTLCAARMGFVKDQSTTHIQFPPRLQRSFDSDIPLGHLRPLGWHRLPEGRVPEMNTMPDPEPFRTQYEIPSKPIVFRNAITDVPATTLWTDEYLKQKYGQIDVHVTVKKEVFKGGPQQMKMKKFIREYMYEDWYLANIVPQEMMTELALPKCLKCGFHQYLQEAEMWLSSGGTSSLLHSHADHNMHCLHSGRKDFILVEKKNVAKMPWVNRDPYEGAGYAKMDMEMINMYAHGYVAQIPWTWSTLKPGDCIFIPSGYPHQVRSYGRSLSTTMHWAPAPGLDFKDCTQKDLNKLTPLSDAPFIWTYSVADRQLTNMRLNAASLRHHIVVWMGMDDAFKYELFEATYGDIMSQMSSYPDVKTVWNMLAPANAKQISREDVAKLEESKLTKVADILNSPHQKARHDEL